MSWSISTQLNNTEGFSDVSQNLEQLQAMDRSKAGNDHCLVERDEQIDTAQKITSVLLATEVFQNAETLSVSLFGHANAGHKKSAEGWANEGLNISVSIQKYRGES
jgi:hypothetical protein